MATALNGQLVLNRQIAYLAENDVFEQEEAYPQLAPVKIPDLKAIPDERARKCFSARLQAYDIIVKVLEHSKAETISETQQSMYLSALKRELSPFLSISFKKPGSGENPSASPSMVTNLHQYLAKMAIESLVQLMRSNLGVQFTRRSVGQVIRLLTNLIFQSEFRQLVLHSVWVFSYWNFDVETVPMVSRAMETLDRAEEATLNNQGWIPFWACTNWKESVPLVPEAYSGFDAIAVAWSEPQWMLASSYEMVLHGKTSARLVSLVDAITFLLANPEIHNSASIRNEALTALQRLIRLIPGPMMNLQHRWLHALYPSLFDSKLGAAKQEVALGILMEVSNHLYTQPPLATTSHILLHCISPPSDTSPNATIPSYKIYHHIQEGFASPDVKVVLRTVSIWGPLVLLLGEGLFKANMINVMLKLLQTTFTHMDPNIRTLSFRAWSFLLLAFSQTSTGLRIWKRLKLLHLPIIRAYTQEDNFAVLYAAFDTQVQLISSLRAHMAVDWLVILAQPLQVLIKNPLAHTKVSHDMASPATCQSSQPSAFSLPPSSTPSSPYELSIIDRYCLLICRMLQNQEVSGSISLQTGFRPFEPLKFVPHTLKSDEGKKHKSWNMSVVAMEREMHHALRKRTEEDRSQQNAAPDPPSLSGTPSSHSFLSLVLSLIIHCVNSAKPLTGGDSPKSLNSSTRVDLALARTLWMSLCDNLAEHMLKSPSNEALTRGIAVSAQNILSWSLLLLCAVASISDYKKQWSQFLEEAIKSTTHMHAPLCHKFSNSSNDGPERASSGLRALVADSPSTFAQFCHWIIGPTRFDYSVSERTNSSSASGSEPPPALRSAPFFGLDDLVSYCFEQLHQDEPPFEQSSEIWAKRSSVDRVTDFVQSFSHNTQLVIRSFCETLPTSNGALENVLHILRPMPLQFQQTVHPGIQNLSNDILASQKDSSELAEVLFRLNMSFCISARLIDLLRDSIHETALIYPLHLYHTTSHHSSPSRHQKTAIQSSGHSPASKAGFEVAPSHITHAASSMEGIVEFEAGGMANARNATTLLPTTFPTTHSLALGGTFIPLSGKSSRSSTTSHQTTTKSGGTNLASGSSSSSSDALVVTESRHPRLLLRDVLECIAHPLQLVKRMIQILSPLQDDAHPGTNALAISIIRTVLTKAKREELSLSVRNLIQMVARICQHRSIDLALSNRTPVSPDSGNSSAVQMSLVFYMNLIQLLHQFRDITTFRQIDHLDSSQASQSQKFSKSGNAMAHVRIWYLQLWYDCFELVIDGFISIPVSRHSFPLREALWEFKDVITTFTTESGPFSKESSDLIKEMASKVEEWKMPRSKPSLPSDALTLSPMTKEGLDYLMEMSIPDWSIVWGEKNAFNLKSSSSSSSSSSRSENPSNHLDFAPFGNMPQPDDTGDERTMSGWSKFCRRIVCCYGMIWRSNLLLLKHQPKVDAVGSAISNPTSNNEQWAQSTESVLGVSNSVLHSVLKFLEKWNYGYNLQVDLLAVVCWALASDSAAAKVSRSAQSLSILLKKPLENVAGATLACIARCFAAVAGTDAVKREDASNAPLAGNVCLVPLSHAIQALLKRTSSVWVVMFESKRSVVRKLAWRTWSHTFDAVKGLTCAHTALRDLVLEAHHKAPEEVVLVDEATWRSGVSSNASSLPSSQVGRVADPLQSSKMDVCMPEEAKVDDSAVQANGTTLVATEEGNSLHQPASLFPIDHKHRREVDVASLEQMPEIKAEPALAGAKSPFQPRKIANGGAHSPNPSSSPTASPHKVKLGLSNTSFVPQRTMMQTTAAKTESMAATDPTTAALTPSLLQTSNPPISNPKSTSVKPEPKSQEAKHTTTQSQKYLEWAEALALVARSAPRVLEDPNLTIHQLVEAQQHALQLATAISQRVAKGSNSS